MTTSLATGVLLRKIREHVQKGTYIISAHALERQNLRSVDLKDVLYVLKNGVRDEEKDLFDNKRQAWKYAIHGKTTENVNLRIIIAFENDMVIITVMGIK